MSTFTLRAQWLGQLLRELREERGYTLKEPAEYIQRTTGTLSRLETAEYPIRRPDVLALLDFYGVSEKRQRDGILRLADEVWQKGWWDEDFADAVYDRKFVDYVWLEQRAHSILAFDNTALPGLLHTRDYARALITAAEPGATSQQIDRWVELRLARQAVLTRDDPVEFHVILDEAVLLRKIGGVPVLREQLQHLVVSGKRPNVAIRVLPFDVGAHASPAGSFKLFLMPEPYPEAGYAETPAGALYVEPPKTEQLSAAYDGLLNDALSHKASMGVISAAIEDLE
jgi:transcriptional regulator with XRE-family HTH domain